MNWREMINTVSKETHLSKSDVRVALSSMVHVTQRCLLEEEEVWLRGLGTFTPRWTRGRTVRSISSGRRMWVGGRLTAKFRPSTVLKERLSKISNQAWKSPQHQAAWQLAETLISDLQLYFPESSPTITKDMNDTAVRQACQRSFGNNWEQAVQTYNNRVPQPVQTTSDYLATAARRVWKKP